jgi:hypothetical protein
MATQQSIQSTKLCEGVSFTSFAKLINKSKSYVSQLKSANRLVLSEDGKRVLVEESKVRIKATSDPAKWPLTLYHEAGRKLKAEVKPAELIPDPDDDFLRTLFSDATANICAELMLDSGISLKQAAHSFNAICWAIVRTREEAGYKSEVWRLCSPIESSAPDDWKAEIQAEIEEIVRREKVLEEEYFKS